jgi:hypothetical protein
MRDLLIVGAEDRGSTDKVEGVRAEHFFNMTLLNGYYAITGSSILRA